MNYKFPVIETIDDVLYAIKDRQDFIVAKRDDITIINYMVAFPDTFKMKSPDDLEGAIRRECRGLIFNSSGVLISRPFHKFFNIGEKEETQPHMININKPHTVYEKLDGSMIRLIKTGEYYRLATKMGVTDVSMQAEKILTYTQRDWLIHKYANGFTPILEFVAPDNKIVVNYDQPNLFITAMRDNYSGKYVDFSNSPFDSVPSYDSVNDIDAYIASIKSQKDREGDVIRFHDGHMLKIKNEWYTDLHKMKEEILFDRNIIKHVLDQTIDDILASLDQKDKDRINQVSDEFWKNVQNASARLLGLESIARTVYDGDKKRVALELAPNLVNKKDAGFIYKLLGGKNVNDLVLDVVRNSLNTNVKYEEVKCWMSS